MPPKRAAPTSATSATAKKVKAVAATETKAPSPRVTRGAAKRKTAEDLMETPKETPSKGKKAVKEAAEEVAEVEEPKAKKAKAAPKEAAVAAVEPVVEDATPKKAAKPASKKATPKTEKTTPKKTEEKKEEEEKPKSTVKPVSKKATPKKAAEAVEEPKEVAKPASKKVEKPASKKAAKAAAPKEPTPEPEAEKEDNFIGAFSSDGEDEGADSSDDESDAEDAAVKAAGARVEVSKLPHARDDKTVAARLKRAAKKKDVERATLFLGRIPHGFYEEQMKEYFGQFGDVTRLRLARNPKTGASRHYAYLEFSSEPVAEIVADTMHNYLLMGHLLQCQVIPKDEVHPELWVGANKKFRKVPRARLEKVRNDKARTKEQQARANEKVLKRQEERRSKIKAAGIDYDFAGH